MVYGAKGSLSPRSGECKNVGQVVNSADDFYFLLTALASCPAHRFRECYVMFTRPVPFHLQFCSGLSHFS